MKDEKEVKKKKHDSNHELEELKDKNKELEDKYIRLQAEYQNFIIRTSSEQQIKLKYEGEEIIKSFLSVIDNFERAIIMDDSDLSDEVSLFLKGFKMIYGNMMNILNNLGVSEIECLGLEFDPNIAEAILTEHDDNKPENVVLEVLTKGYKYKDKIIRPAMVKVNI